MLTHVEFRSDDFPPYIGEEDNINPGCYGQRLCEFLVDKLNQHGETTGEVFPEDWGWVIPIENITFDLWIGVGHYEEYDNGFLCFIEPHTEVLKRWFKSNIPTKKRISELQCCLDSILKEREGIIGVKWWSNEEFNNLQA
ncbi:hypothetical protein Q4519_02890 [Motilimonas sp. 1_MG-2023]|uniref:hypothetical protein n=1 Tax=Motilimonas sp. 1_MG-2023 TaxID=3062672 RepID=UPI0026E1FC2C|nr:hypothetical protein [Motilimonas sp. 1_MG-2023]MDO6524622.1 hypothetical protein [Motilimonas sp. 1_MG-2023]